MESIITDDLIEHLIINNLIMINNVIWFRSCSLQLLSAVNHWTNLLQDGNPVDIAYFDFRKAFDLVPHKCLLSKLLPYGIEGEIHGRLCEFITSSYKSQRVVLNGKLSD